MTDSEFYEDIERKGRWLFEQRGTWDVEELDRRRDVAVEHLERMRTARATRLDPGGGPIQTAVSLSGGGRGSRTVQNELPGHVGPGAFLSQRVEVRTRTGWLSATLKVKPNGRDR
jgi:hypothetical protein